MGMTRNQNPVTIVYILVILNEEQEKKWGKSSVDGTKVPFVR